MGSIRGGAVRKLIISKHRDKPGWYFPPEYENERVHGVRHGRGSPGAFEYADEERREEIDEIARPRWVPNRKPHPRPAAYHL